MYVHEKRDINKKLNLIVLVKHVADGFCYDYSPLGWQYIQPIGFHISPFANSCCIWMISAYTSELEEWMEDQDSYRLKLYTEINGTWCGILWLSNAHLLKMSARGYIHRSLLTEVLLFSSNIFLLSSLTSWVFGFVFLYLPIDPWVFPST